MLGGGQFGSAYTVFKSAETMTQIREYNDVEVFLHYEPEKGHNGLIWTTRSAFYTVFSKYRNRVSLFIY